MQKIISLFLLSFILSAVAIKKEAQAGMVIAKGGVIYSNDKLFPYGIAGMGLTITSFVIGGVTGNHIALGFGIAFFCVTLDAEGNLPLGSIEAKLAERFPFIDDQGALNNLAKKIKTKYDALNANGREAYISLSQSEVKECLSAVDLNDSELELIVTELK